MLLPPPPQQQQHLPLIVELRINLAVTLTELKQYEDAKTELVTALDDHSRAPELTKANALRNLGEVHLRMDEFKDASRRFNEALSIRQKLLPAGHSDRILTMESIGVLRMCRKKYCEAEKWFKDAVEESERSGCAPSDATLQRCKDRLTQVQYVISQREKGLRVKLT